MRQAMIFAAGMGTRLKPLTDTMPKALVRVGGKPLLWHVLINLKKAGFQRVVINVHHFADQIINYLKANHHFGLDIRISDEREMLLETGGGIRKAIPLLDDKSPVLIHNVDILSNVDLKKFYEIGEESRAEATLLVSWRKTMRYLLFDKHHQLKGWTNLKTGEVRTPFEDLEINQVNLLAFSGIHLIKPSLFALLEEWPLRFPIMDFYLDTCSDHHYEGCEMEDLRLLDVGKLDSLEEAEKLLKLLKS